MNKKVILAGEFTSQDAQLGKRLRKTLLQPLKILKRQLDNRVKLVLRFWRNVPKEALVEYLCKRFIMPNERNGQGEKCVCSFSSKS